MSNTSEWMNRAEKHRYSQDDRTKQWKYEKELTPQIDAFIEAPQVNTLNLGTFNFNLEPWKLAAIMSFRRFNLKVNFKNIEEHTEVIIAKGKKF